MDGTGSGPCPKADFCIRGVKNSGSANRDLVNTHANTYGSGQTSDFSPSVSTRLEHCGTARLVSTCLTWMTGQKEE